MSAYSIEDVRRILQAMMLKQGDVPKIEHLVYDSRALVNPANSLFFAITTSHSDGHSHIEDAYDKGTRNFVVEKKVDYTVLEGANVLLVNDSVEAMQKLATHHRKKFSAEVIGITGSNGKTIVKEWLYQLLSPDGNIVRSPKSFNSQIGVPISVWQLESSHTLGIFEAGISTKGEMEKLAAVIQPTIGLLTNIGEAHDEGFSSKHEKLHEKLKLFTSAGIIIGNNKLLNSIPPEKKFTWGKDGDANLFVEEIKTTKGKTKIKAQYLDYPTELTIPFTDEASIENAINCWTVMLYFEYNEPTINERFAKLHAVDMRLQLVKGINNSTIINDSYSADLTSLNIALHFLANQKTAQTHTVILSDFAGSGLPNEELYRCIAEALKKHDIRKVVCIGTQISQYLPAHLQDTEIISYPDTEQFIQHNRNSTFRDETILVKGARSFQFERIVQLLQTKVHQTVLEINLNAIAHNLKEYKKLLKPATKVMAMVKAFSYGSGGAEIASILQFNKADYLAVAYADEGVELRAAGISLPIMVMNTDESSFYKITEYNMEPVIYSFAILEKFEQHLRDQALSEYPVHIEIETGMNRLGFHKTEVGALATHLSQNQSIRIKSVFSHLAASEDKEHDEFTNQQYNIFLDAVDEIKKAVSYPFLKHISNSAAIIRHPEMHLDMVRLGIGLYGIEISTKNLSLQQVASLKTTIAQIKNLKAGETVSYNRKSTVTRDSVIATVRLGYADGYTRKLGNGKGKMVVRGQLVPVIGNVCMDMTMLDVTGIKGVQAGDEVFVFGKELPVETLAGWAETIPYEILTSISQRVKRVYYQE